MPCGGAYLKRGQSSGGMKGSFTYSSKRASFDCLHIISTSISGATSFGHWLIQMSLHWASQRSSSPTTQGFMLYIPRLLHTNVGLTCTRPFALLFSLWTHGREGRSIERNLLLALYIHKLTHSNFLVLRCNYLVPTGRSLTIHMTSSAPFLDCVSPTLM